MSMWKNYLTNKYIKMYTIKHPIGGHLNHNCEKDKFEYEDICILVCNSLQEAFEMSQNDFNEFYALLGKRSTSVGDIIVTPDNVHYFVDKVGFTEIPATVSEWKPIHPEPKVVGKIDLDNSSKPSDVSVRRVGNMIEFSIPMKVSLSHTYHLQAELGYPAAGYGHYNFQSSLIETKWLCSQSSD